MSGQEAGDRPRIPDGQVSARSFVDQSVIISRHTTEQYAHQSSLRIIKGMGYVVYQCNETTPEENKAGQTARLAIFNLLAPASTARWLDVSGPEDASNGITTTGKFVSSPMLHVVNEDTLRIFFNSKQDGDTTSAARVYFKDYTIPTSTLSGLHQVRCTIAGDAATVLDLCIPTVQRHLDFLFGAGTGAKYARGLSTACDFVPIDGKLYSCVQMKNSENGKTLLMTNTLMRSADDGATWELLGAPDPTALTSEVKILAEPVITHDAKNIYLHLRSNDISNGYMLSRTAKSDLRHFEMFGCAYYETKPVLAYATTGMYNCSIADGRIRD